MAHRASIACDECRMPLGEIVGSGGLRLLTAGPTILGPSSAAIECPRCYRPRIWPYQQTMMMTSIGQR